MKHTVSLKKNHEFRRLYARGKSAASGCLVLYVRRNGRPCSRLGITTGVKLGNAVVRNRVRRRIREIYRHHEDRLPAGIDLVVVARGRAAQARYPELERSFLQLTRRLGLLQPGEGDGA